jgi:tetratricopeptide (TPR) repeat protein
MITNIFLKKTVLIFLAFFLTGILNVYCQDNLQNGIDAVKKGDYVRALELLKTAPKDKYEGSLYYGIALFKTGSLADAEKSLKNAISIDNEKPEAYAVLGELYTSQKKYSESASQFDMATKYLPLNVATDNLSEEDKSQIISVLTKEAENFLSDGKAGDVDKAITVLTQAKTYDPKNPMVYVGLGDAYRTRGAFDIAQTNYEQSLKIKSFAPAYYGLGKISYTKKKYNDALDYYTKATDADNNFAPAFFEKGVLLYLNDNFKMAIDAFERYGQLVPGSPKGKAYIAKAKYGEGNYDESMALLQEILAADPSNSDANKYMAYNYIEKKDYDKAEDSFSKVKPEDLNSEDYMKWSKIFSDKRNFSKAYELLDKSLSMDSVDENTYFEYGKALFSDTTNANHYAAALEKFSKAIDLGIQNVAAWIYSGICYFYLNDFDKSVTMLNKSIDLNPNISSAYLWKGNALASAKKNPEAIDAYKKYLTMQPDDQFAKDQIDKLSKDNGK